MFQVLSESKEHATQGSARWSLMSALAHATLITAAVAVTSRDAPTLRIERPRAESLTYVAVRPTSRQPDRASGETSPRWKYPALPIFQLRDVPGVDVAIERGVNLPADDYWATPGGFPSGGEGIGIPAGGIYTDRLVDRPVMARLDNGAPEYPRALRASGVEGDVTARFVVDTTGRVEPTSISITQATHAFFGDAVRRWLSRTRYLPAEAGGHPVRQLVEQRIGFTLER